MFSEIFGELWILSFVENEVLIVGDIGMERDRTCFKTLSKHIFRFQQGETLASQVWHGTIALENKRESFFRVGQFRTRHSLFFATGIPPNRGTDKGK